MPEWLELELAHRLAPAKAPDELWERVRHATHAPPERRQRSLAFVPVAAMVMILFALGTLLMVAKGERPVPAPRHLALEQPQHQQQPCSTCHMNL